jgi:hypothetical protein
MQRRRLPWWLALGSARASSSRMECARQTEARGQLRMPRRPHLRRGLAICYATICVPPMTAYAQVLTPRRRVLFRIVTRKLVAVSRPQSNARRPAYSGRPCAQRNTELNLNASTKLERTQIKKEHWAANNRRFFWCRVPNLTEMWPTHNRRLLLISLHSSMKVARDPNGSGWHTVSPKRVRLSHHRSKFVQWAA